jgi:hypothetical protein
MRDSSGGSGTQKKTQLNIFYDAQVFSFPSAIEASKRKEKNHGTVFFITILCKNQKISFY